jgi:hypothetical protein
MGRTKTLEEAKNALIDETAESVFNLLQKLARESKIGRLTDGEIPRVEQHLLTDCYYIPDFHCVTKLTRTNELYSQKGNIQWYRSTGK